MLYLRDIAASEASRFFLGVRLNTACVRTVIWFLRTRNRLLKGIASELICGESLRELFEGNHVCVRAFLLWNAFDIVVTFACDIALYYLVQFVSDEGYRALKSAMETTREDTTSTLDYMQENIMERYPLGRDHFDSDYETTTERITTRESFPRKVVAFTEKIQSKPSLPQIVLVAIFKIAAWKIAYARRRSTLHSILESTRDMQAQGTGEAHAPRSVDAPPYAVPGTPEGVRDGSPCSGSPRKCRGDDDERAA
ncbi:uncharacterized protein LOC142579343 isoform X2 [Dermacentor variabilis]|uniref:uncharacterized protein LOC142579343 isoform X2 n=1 Tax=Dermacentor variabilis TaxID=34621 RepID=UPI003F5B5CF1